MFGDNPPTWNEFKQAVTDEFLAPAERWSRAMQFEKLKQTPGVSVEDYARDFIRLSKYAPYMMPTEAVRMDRFKAGLITPLYNLLATTEYPSLSRLIDMAKQLEARHNEDRAEREHRKQISGRTQASKEKSEDVKKVEQVTHAMPPNPYKDKKRRKPFRRDPPVRSAPTVQPSYGRG